MRDVAMLGTVVLYISCGILCDIKVLRLQFYVQGLRCYRDE